MPMQKEKHQTFRIFTDGACNNRSVKRGGWGFVVIFNSKKIYSTGGFEKEETTSNRMELTSVLQALLYLIEIEVKKSEEILIISDSMYVVNSLNNDYSLLKSWYAKNFRHYVKNDEGISVVQDIKNKDLWSEIYACLKNIGEVKFKWVKGHSGNEYNELADRIAVRMRKFAENVIEEV